MKTAHQWRIELHRLSTGSTLLIDMPPELNEEMNEIKAVDKQAVPPDHFIERMTDWVIEEFNAAFLPVQVISENPQETY